ncbi:flavin reductase family protein [Microvirga thermotolerans]|uniref:Flavin reductase family protein n=1 Tax=Microvirga thermotolerans TaxID=2651334 RepID=A0A5P9K061_9HYPH|nr:flavin reductase family protein [Microvirga thermotolerans]QFU17286.1 flavin reductase family protein [Microvirga thermotolerans]
MNAHSPNPVPVHRTIRPSVLYFGTPVVLLTTLNPDGTPNISPLSSAWALGDRVVLGLSNGGQGGENVVREGECVINVAPADLWERVERLARTTGRSPVPADKAAAGYVHEPRKFEAAGLTPLASDLVRPPRIAECPLQLEARVVAAHAPGGGPWAAGSRSGFAIVETRVERVHAHEAIVVPGTNHVDVSRWQPLLYVFRHYVAAGEDLGRTFKAEA